MILFKFRWEMSKPEEYYWQKENVKTLDQIKKMAGKSNNNYGCVKPPLLNIPLENIRVDELHLCLG